MYKLVQLALAPQPRAWLQVWSRRRPHPHLQLSCPLHPLDLGQILQALYRQPPQWSMVLQWLLKQLAHLRPNQLSPEVRPQVQTNRLYQRNLMYRSGRRRSQPG